MNVKETFLKFTHRTYPHGTESELLHLLPVELETDEFDNKYIQIGESPSCMFTCHLDTATSANTEIIHVFDGNIIKTDGKSILGADDKAGLTVMLYMIENKVPGLYYFFLGEEVGCVGSRKVSAKHKITKLDNIKKVISFDRRAYDSVITFQSSGRCCSDVFGEALAKELNRVEESFKYKIDPTGVYTDSAQFTKIYPECTNISVGYRYEHTFSEQQDIEHLDTLAKACIKVDWENLPIERDPNKVEYSSRYEDWDYEYGGYSSYYGNWSSKSGTSSYVRTTVEQESIHFFDPDFDHVSTVKIQKHTNKLVGVEFSEDRILDEKWEIIQLLDSLEVDWEQIDWDGMKLKVKHSFEAGGHTTECSRDDLTDFLPSFNFWKEYSKKDDEELIHHLVF